MKLIVRLAFVLLLILAAMPFIQPDAPVSKVVMAAVEDATSFCDRRPEACHQSADIAYRTSTLVSDALRSILKEAQPANGLTAADRALSPPLGTDGEDAQTDAATAAADRPAIAGHNGSLGSEALPQP